ncbi:PAS domain S-box protein [Sesbania bispinosa]|nr:PAS domain S-box protein [Sesbania bispinosa]
MAVGAPLRRDHRRSFIREGGLGRVPSMAAGALLPPQPYCRRDQPSCCCLLLYTDLQTMHSHRICNRRAPRLDPFVSLFILASAPSTRRTKLCRSPATAHHCARPSRAKASHLRCLPVSDQSSLRAADPSLLRCASRHCSDPHL